MASSTRSASSSSSRVYIVDHTTSPDSGAAQAAHPEAVRHSGGHVSQVKEQAEVLRHSLVAGCISRDDVVEWALSMVFEDDRLQRPKELEHPSCLFLRRLVVK